MADDQGFAQLRPGLFGLAYRMLGSAADAEDVLQDAYLRWQRQPGESIRSPRSYLTTLVTRLCLDSLTSARARREQYVGPWLPEPMVVDAADPAQAAEMADSLSLAFLVLLEELSPPERAAFLLHDVFAFRYDEVADILSRTAPGCRQLVARARQHVGARRQRFDADRERASQLTRSFILACGQGDLEGLVALLADDAGVWTDGGGKAKSAPRPILGARKAARFLVGITRSLPSDAHVRQLVLNGQPGLVMTQADAVLNVVVLDIMDDRISGVRIVVNPEKLGSVRQALAARSSLHPDPEGSGR